MKKMTEEEVFKFISGENLIEFVPISFDEAERVLEFLKGNFPFIATKDGTFKVQEEVFRELINKGYKIKRLDGA